MKVPTSDSSDCTNGAAFLARPDAAVPKEVERCDAHIEGLRCLLDAGHGTRGNSQPHIYDTPKAIHVSELDAAPPPSDAARYSSDPRDSGHVYKDGVLQAPPTDTAQPVDVENLAHSLWVYGALSFKGDACDGGYGLDDIPKEQAEAFRELARNVIKAIYAHPEDAPGGPDYWQGVRDGIRKFAWWADGEQFVGTCGTTLKDALNRLKGETDG